LRRAAFIVLTVALLEAVVTTAQAGSPNGKTDLRIAYRASATAPTQILTLHCTSAAGTVPRPAYACDRLKRLWPNAFAVTPPGKVCTQIAGPPTTALITGWYGGGRVWVRLSQSDGCQIARWNRVRFLFPQ
jgi:hypothetical protein